MTDYGKQLEGQITAAFRRWPRTPFVMRIKDGAQSKGKTSKNPADIIACGELMDFLIEAKATKAKSIRFDRVKSHQRSALRKFSTIPGKRHVGFVAVLFYNGKRGHTRVYRCFLIEGSVWQKTWKRARRGEFSKSGKKVKSLKMSHLEDGTVKCMELVWVAGTGWDMEASFVKYGEAHHG